MKIGRARDVVTVGVVLNGPTSNPDIYSFAFDLKLSGSPVEYIAGSAAAGDALVPGPGQAVVVQAVQTGDRVVIGVSKTGAGQGSAVGDSRVTIVSLSFRVLQKGKTQVSFAGPPAAAAALTTPGPAALDAAGAVIPGIVFDAATGIIVGKRV